MDVMGIILVEGLDRSGKTTECRRIMAQPRTKPTIMVHFVAPPKGQDAQVLREMAKLYNIALANPDVDFVLDRGHVSYYAYNQILRRAKPEVPIQDFERVFWNLDVRVVYCHAPAEELMRRDDGASTYKDVHEARREQQAFRDVLEASRWGRPYMGPGLV